MLNNLPLYMYIADIISNSEGIIVTIAILMTCAMLIFIGFYFFFNGENYLSDSEEKTFTLVKKSLKFTIIGTILSYLLCAIMPSEKTIYSYIGLKSAQEINDNYHVDNEVMDIYKDVKTIIHKMAADGTVVKN